MVKKILVLDDDQGILTALSFMLEELGIKYSTHSDISILKKISDKEIGLVLIDLLISGKDGGDLIKSLKSKKETKNIPIIMFSAHPNAKDISKKSGANDFLEKPFEMDELLNLIKKYFK